MAKPKLPKTPNNLKPTNSTSEAEVSQFVEPLDTAAPASVPAARKTESKKSARKPEIVKPEPRPNLVPINLEDEIRRFAYLLAERRGFEPGHDAEDWLAAEREVRQRYHQHSA